MVKNLPFNTGDAGLIGGLEGSPEEGNGNLVGLSPWGCKRIGQYLATKQQQSITLNLAEFFLC